MWRGEGSIINDVTVVVVVKGSNKYVNPLTFIHLELLKKGVGEGV